MVSCTISYEGYEITTYSSIHVFTENYVVAGTANLCGSTWDGKDINNIMTKTEGEEIYTKVYENVPVGEYQIKVQRNLLDGIHEWISDGTDDNIKFKGPRPCDVTVTYNITERKATVSGSGVEMVTDLVIDAIYAVGNGDSCGLNNSPWDPGAEQNRMTEISEGVYQIIYTDVEFFDAYEFKFAANGTWADNWGDTDLDGNGVGDSNITDGGTFIGEYNGKNFNLNVVYEFADVILTLDLTEFDYATKLVAKVTVEVVDAAEPCTHNGTHTNGVCDRCQQQRAFSVTVGDSVSYFDDMIEAFDAAKTGTEQSPATIKLLTNVTHTNWKRGVKEKGAYIVLDLNGYTLTFTHEDAFIQVLSGSHFTLMDSSEGETGSIVADYIEQYPTTSNLIRVLEQSTMILQSGRLVPHIYAAEAILVEETSTLIQNGGVIEGTAVVAVSVLTGSLFTQNGGTIISNGFAVEIEDDGSRYVLEGGTLLLNGNRARYDGGYFDFYESDGTVTINGGVFDAVGASGASISMPTRYMIGRGAYGDCKIIINAATFKNTDNAALCITNGCYDGSTDMCRCYGGR